MPISKARAMLGAFMSIGRRRGRPEIAPEVQADVSSERAQERDARALTSDLALAAEHVQSIRVLLEISRAHQQPIPAAALRNLELVSKHLRDMQTRMAP